MTEENLASMAELASAHNIKVVLSSLLPVSDYTPHRQTQDRAPQKIRELNAWIRHYCRSKGMTYLDYYSHLVDSRGMLGAGLSDDGLHPNAAGYKIMAPLAQHAIRRALRAGK
jgi:lysophospholipase L1-like esterase